MALMYDVELTPSKPEFVAMLLERATWFDSDTAGIELVGHYRFDDPAGQVGIEAHIVRAADGTFWHVPMTYRREPLEAAEAGLVTTTEHPVLGDPVPVRRMPRPGGGERAGPGYRLGRAAGQRGAGRGRRAARPGCQRPRQRLDQR
ncbi:hypothetical protein I6J30_00525 [Kytococcus sedentarius]|nr:hypothetical protein I6J30_00525 [Kytococcus sedentarius]